MVYFLIGLIVGAIGWEILKWAWRKYILKQQNP
jgi:hypothetical protein